MEHGRAQLLQDEERQQHEQQQGCYRMPGVDNRVTVQRQVHVNQKIVSQGEQHGQRLQGGVHSHHWEGKSGDGERDDPPK